MDWQNDRLSKRLTFSPEQTEEIYAILSEIDAIKNAFRLTDKLLPPTINRLTQSVVVTSTGASNRIEGNRLSDEEVEALYRNLRIRKFKTRDEQEVAGYLEMLTLVIRHVLSAEGLVHLDVLVGLRAAVPKGRAHGLELLGHPANAYAEYGAASGHTVQLGHHLGV